MTLPPPSSDDHVERQLAEYLARQAAALDVTPLLGRIRQGMADQAPRPSRRSRFGGLRRAVGWAVATAAAAFISLYALLGGESEPLRASPQALLQEAQKVHHLPLDRCYLVEFQCETGLTDESNPMARASRTTRLWTRGDRFWIEGTSPRARWAWGRDENGTIWITPNSRRGVRIDPDEAPRWLTFTCDICELRPEHLLGELLRDFDLTREDGPTPATQIIQAERKPGRWALPLRSAVLELDTESKVLRRVVLRRGWGNQAVTTTYLLVETQTQTDDRYRLEGHLKAPYDIYSADHQPHRRREVLAMLFGPRGVDWIKPVPKEGPK